MKLSLIKNKTGVVSLDTELDSSKEAEVQRLLDEAVRKNAQEIVYCFSSLRHMNPDGAGILVKAVAAVKSKKIRLFSYGLSDRYREIFRITSLERDCVPIDDTSLIERGFTDARIQELKGRGDSAQYQKDDGWSPNIPNIRITEKPAGAINKNMEGRSVTGPPDGFGFLWQKTYSMEIQDRNLQPRDVIDIMKQRLPEFQPHQNKFYPTSRGISPGEVIFIDSMTPGGIVSTGVVVLYADETSFSLITPKGHPEAGWVTFSAATKNGGVEMKIQGLARASDPVYELAFRIAGSAFQEKIWKHVLSSLGTFLNIEPKITVKKHCFGKNLQWHRAGNVWYNAQIRSFSYTIPKLIFR